MSVDSTKGGASDGLSSCGPSQQAVSAVPASIPDAQYKAMRRLCGPMIRAAYKMSGEEIADAMKGFYATSQTNCPWYAYALRFAMPPLLATIGSDKPGYHEAFLAQGTEAQRAETGTGSVHDGPVAESDAPQPGIASNRGEGE